MSLVTVQTQAGSDFVTFMLDVLADYNTTRSTSSQIVLKSKDTNHKIVLEGKDLDGIFDGKVETIRLLEGNQPYVEITKLDVAKTALFIAFASGDPDLFLDLFGNVTFAGASGNDSALTGLGNDTHRGGDGNDNLHAESGNDLLIGGAGNDTLVGDHGNDILRGTTGRDQLFGHSGNDTLNAGVGQDVLAGGSGADTFAFTSLKQTAGSLAKADQITDWSGKDVLSIAAEAFGGGLEAGASLRANQFRVDKPAQGDQGQFLYSTDSHSLVWDQDGAGSGAGVVVVTFTTNVTLHAGDILLV